MTSDSYSKLAPYRETYRILWVTSTDKAKQHTKKILCNDGSQLKGII